ncbi:glycosyltransferase [Microbacterium abyssi]|uniref:glycosyltransferase n=1 Tax=Microbacterium abyssi TaxID=2782166 RepID=UPI001888A777|nr:hypothetical protein [Microbacterium sp. A18JL241]
MRELLTTTARRMLRILPDGFLARALPGRLGWDAGAMTIVTAPQTAIRLFVGPVNSAGQGYRWARAAERHLVGVGAVSMMTTNPARERFDFPVDVKIPESGFVFAGGWQRRQRDALSNGFTHVLLESGQYLYGSVAGRDPLDVAADAVAQGLQVALLWHGSDIRVPSHHADIERDSPFGPNGNYPPAATDVLESNASARIEGLGGAGLPVFVSTPGLLDVPGARWLPVVVEVEQWRSHDDPLRRPVPVVAYVPSNSPMKGDPSIDEQLVALEADGHIVYRRLEGIPARQMPDVYRSADIVLDQFRLGDYGVAACEALAAGRVVIGHVSSENRSRVRDLTGHELPIVESRFADVGETIMSVLGDREAHVEAARRGPAFVSAVHDGAASAAALASFLGASGRA